MVNRYNPRRRLRRRRHHRENKRAKDIISSLPDDILQHIISFVPTKFAIRTSILSKRWRHIWSINTPPLYFDISTEQPASIDETLMRYTAPKMKQFHLKTNSKQNVYYIERWIGLATSRNVEYCPLEVPVPNLEIPRCFSINSSLKQLNVELAYSNMIHRCIVSWPSLKKLSLRCCSLPDDSIAMISSGCPILECLTLLVGFELFSCSVRVLDLSKLLQLRTLEIIIHYETPIMTIVAPHIQCLRLITSQWLCTLVDISSCSEANLDICMNSRDQIFNGYLLQDMVLDMLETLQNVEKVTIGGNFLQILSLAEFHGVSVRLPMLRVKTLTLETVIFKYVVPGIERLLQNSPDLEKLIVRARDCNTIPGNFLMEYLNRLGLDPDKCWRSKDGVLLNKSRRNVESKHVTSFIEIMLKNTKKLDKMFIQLDERDLSFKFKDLVPTLPPNKNVSISLSSKPKI